MVIQISLKLLRTAFNGRLVLVLFNLLVLLRQTQSYIQGVAGGILHTLGTLCLGEITLVYSKIPISESEQLQS
jgi:hypothetical protein